MSKYEKWARRSLVGIYLAFGGTAIAAMTNHLLYATGGCTVGVVLIVMTNRLLDKAEDEVE